MSIQASLEQGAKPPAPWVEWWDVLAKIETLSREGWDTSALEQRAAELRQACGDLGGLLILTALENGSWSVVKAIRELVSVDLVAAWDQATSARRAAKAALQQNDALKQRISELERRVDGLTCGVGEDRVTVRLYQPAQEG